MLASIANCAAARLVLAVEVGPQSTGNKKEVAERQHTTLLIQR
jgi:hypothetical protein